MPTATETRTWSIRPTTIHGKRRFVPVAKDSATGGEARIFGSGGQLVSFPTPGTARRFIADRYDGGRAFPAIVDPKAPRGPVASAHYVKRDACYYFAPAMA